MDGAIGLPLAHWDYATILLHYSPTRLWWLFSNTGNTKPIWIVGKVEMFRLIFGVHQWKPSFRTSFPFLAFNKSLSPFNNSGCVIREVGGFYLHVNVSPADSVRAKHTWIISHVIFFCAQLKDSPESSSKSLNVSFKFMSHKLECHQHNIKHI